MLSDKAGAGKKLRLPKAWSRAEGAGLLDRRVVEGTEGRECPTKEQPARAPYARGPEWLSSPLLSLWLSSIPVLCISDCCHVRSARAGTGVSSLALEPGVS